MVYRTGMLAFMLLNGASAFLAIFVAAATAGQRGAAAYFLTALCVYLIVIHSVIMLSGLAGFLTVGGVAALLGVATAAAWWARARGEERSSRDGAVGDSSLGARRWPSGIFGKDPASHPAPVARKREAPVDSEPSTPL